MRDGGGAQFRRGDQLAITFQFQLWQQARLTVIGAVSSQRFLERLLTERTIYRLAAAKKKSQSQMLASSFVTLS